MKKILCAITIFLFCISSIKAQTNQDTPKENINTNQKTIQKDNNNELNIAENAKSAIMLEASTGKIIYEKNSNEQLPMASMTKMMTLLIIMENIENGSLKWDEKVTIISRYDLDDYKYYFKNVRRKRILVPVFVHPFGVRYRIQEAWAILRIKLIKKIKG